MTIIIFILILSFLVLIHELGHFLTAKKFGIKVEEFGMGYPPKALTLHKDKGGTEYTLNWLPFGGFVRMFGEDGSLASEGKGTQGKAFFDKPVWQRMIVIIAGVTINFAFGVVAFALIFSISQIVPSYFWSVRVNGVSVNSPAFEAGLQSGDEIIAARGSRGGRKTLTTSDLTSTLIRHEGELIKLSLKSGEVKEVRVRTREEIPEGEGLIGIVISDREENQAKGLNASILGAKAGITEALLFSRTLLFSLKEMIVDGFAQGSAPQEVAGPVGIVHMAQKEGILTGGWMPRLYFAAILSINLAIINLIPFPALDGGRLIFLLYEGIRRKRINPKIEHYANFAGFMLLISMIVAVSARDISRVAQDVNVQNWFKNLLP